MNTRVFDYLPDGRPVTAYRLEGGSGAYVEVLDYGALILGIHVPDRDGILRDVTLGHDEILPYTTTGEFFGATVGRHANRMDHGRFTLNGKTYQMAITNGPHNLHSGPNSYNTRFFTVTEEGDTLCFSLHSPDGDQGFPGNFDLKVGYRFTPENALHITYRGICDQDTVVNITNHSYFDLSGGQDPQGQLLWLESEFYTEASETTIPSGVISAVKGTPFDFTTEKPVGRDNRADHRQIRLCKGYDHNFILTGAHPYFARLRSEKTGIVMRVSTDMPGVQVYGGNYLSGVRGKGGRVYRDYDAVCLETQFFPGGMGIAHFPSPILRAGEEYRHETVYAFSVEK